VAVDAVVPSDLIAATIVAMVSGEEPPPAVRRNHPRSDSDHAASGDPAVMICPECGGVLTEGLEVGIPQWRCRVGHRYSSEALVDAQAANVEAALWIAIRTLEDRARLLAGMAETAESRQISRAARSFRARAEAAREQARIVREALASAAQTTVIETEHDEGDALAAGGGSG
jgi:two-component system chemotaxis response regulator CheB